MITHFLKALVHFYHTRGRGEIVSFLTSFAVGFGVSFGALAIAQYENLISPAMQLDETAVLFAFLNALFRSSIAGAIYALMKAFAPESMRAKLDEVLLRAKR